MVSEYRILRQLTRISRLAILMGISVGVQASADRACAQTPATETTEAVSREHQPKPTSTSAVPRRTEEKNERIRQALEKQVSLDFVEKPIGDIVRQLARENQIPIVIDHPALDDLGIASDTPMTIELPDVTLRAALHQLLHSLDLTYLVWQEALVITSIDAALDGNYSITRVYPVYDLLAKNLSGQIDYDSLISAIQINVSPDSWPDGGGGIDTYAGTMIVWQNDQMHREIEDFLAALRRGVEPKMLELSESPKDDFLRRGELWGPQSQKNGVRCTCRCSCAAAKDGRTAQSATSKN